MSCVFWPALAEGVFVFSSVTPLPEEFELQGFLALRPALRYRPHSTVQSACLLIIMFLETDVCWYFRSLDFTKGHQGILVDRDGLPVHTRYERLIILGKWVADNYPEWVSLHLSAFTHKKKKTLIQQIYMVQYTCSMVFMSFKLSLREGNRARLLG